MPYLPHGAGAENGISTMMDKEFAGTPWVKATIISTQSDSSP